MYKEKIKNNSGKISVALGSSAAAGTVALTTCALVISVPLVIVIVGGCAVVGVAAGSVYAAKTYFNRKNEAGKKGHSSDSDNDSVRSSDSDTEEQTSLLPPPKKSITKNNQISKPRLEEKRGLQSKNKIINEEKKNEYINYGGTKKQPLSLQSEKKSITKSNQISKPNLEEKSVSLPKKKKTNEETKKATREALYQSAQLMQLDPAQKDLAFDNYLKAAELGEEEALAPLELLAEEMSSTKQLKLSNFYGKFLKDSEKAAYWREKGMENEGINLKK